MIKEGQIVLFQFPKTDNNQGKLRPALVLRKVPGPYKDWLVCMISSQIHQAIENFDEVISGDDGDFADTGLKADSVIRISRVAVVDQKMLLGAIGQVTEERMARIKNSLSHWLTQSSNKQH